MTRPAETARRPVHSTTVTVVREVSPDVFVLGFRPVAPAFRAGESVRVTLPGATVDRDYSLYSGERDPDWEILVREVAQGSLSPQLRACRPGDPLLVSQPGGGFVLDRGTAHLRRHLFVATGTGIAPFRSMARSHPWLRYRVLHGVRTAADRHVPSDFAPGAYLPCVSREAGAGFHGRVTDLLRDLPLDPDTRVHLCGRNQMAYGAWKILRTRGIPEAHVAVEVYF
jgi:ferredoxin--NADP+ reductase/benzoate/toluate 1,2-dioxygenase reductase subunit